MARSARKRSSTGFYHITNRGVNKRDVFFDADDHQCFLRCLKLAQRVCNFKIIAYCIMTNHFHIIIRCDADYPIPPSLFQSVGARFCNYYHNKYRTAGQVFQGRFYSEPIESERHLLSAVRYVWNNPVDAGMCDKPSSYVWSSYNLLGLDSSIVDNEFLMGLMTADEWKKFATQANHDWHLEPFSARRDDTHMREIIRKVCGNSVLHTITQKRESGRCIPAECTRIIEACFCYGVTIAQVARIANVPYPLLYRSVKALRAGKKGASP